MYLTIYLYLAAVSNDNESKWQRTEEEDIIWHD